MMLPHCPNQSNTYCPLGGPCSLQLQVLVMVFSPTILLVVSSNQSCQLISATSMPREAGEFCVPAVPTTRCGGYGHSDHYQVRASLTQIKLTLLVTFLCLSSQL